MRRLQFVWKALSANRLVPIFHFAFTDCVEYSWQFHKKRRLPDKRIFFSFSPSSLTSTCLFQHCCFRQTRGRGWKCNGRSHSFWSLAIEPGCPRAGDPCGTSAPCASSENSSESSFSQSRCYTTMLATASFEVLRVFLAFHLLSWFAGQRRDWETHSFSSSVHGCSVPALHWLVHPPLPHSYWPRDSRC